ncbi:MULTISPECIES: NUDIX domain-containing protein [unclassified Psychrobacter]|uniref:NUDIX domain-containing protein n=1 Tax=unclassified Psychrobacter TaxID=196806 RepID=UPI0025B50F15|nr:MULTISPECIES: NUDIX domain-containing protein [unclassified Psychrobacter]MDN3452689.1 NUDIX domain-containing protein [Psychrobacter sp. APC 3350]MDN3501172.1 NUDIX domain-containing protein [Psychrobacter sp. 5A.1]
MPNGPNQPSKTKTDTKTKTNKPSIVNVAVAVIHHGDKYLLGFRDATQHQGNRYEFVGGKIEASESAEQALVREVAEETGILMDSNTIVKLGRLHHDYGDKQVSLQVYKIELTAEQYEQHKHHEQGLEGQALTWVSQSQLLAGAYHLPAANKTILDWLRLPSTIAITYPLAYFSAHTDAAMAWRQYHQEHIASESWVYIRLQHSDSEHLADQLMTARPDILAILPYDNEQQPSNIENLPTTHDVKIGQQIVAKHLTHSVLIQCCEDIENLPASVQLLPSDYPLIVSCHDVASIMAANKLARMRIQRALPPVIGAFLSPVLATKTHPDTPPLGWEVWSALAELADMPVIGLGGLEPVMLNQALQYGGISVAGIRQFIS